VNRIATFMIGFVLGGAVVGGAIYLSDTQDDSTTGPIEQQASLDPHLPKTHPLPLQAVPTIQTRPRLRPWLSLLG
jgi:hypothetical protein